MPSAVTQCPKCRTSFRVSDAQLSIANGSVRCGSCLHIFNATEHWLDNREKSAGASDLKTEGFDPDNEPIFSDTAQRPAISLFDESDEEFSAKLNRHSLFDGDSESDDLLADIDKLLPPDSDDGEDPSAIEQLEETFDDTLDDSDDAILLSEDDLLIQDDPELDQSEDPPTPPEKAKTELSDTFLNLDEWDEDDETFKAEDDDEQQESTEAWARKLLDEEQEDDAHRQPAPAAASARPSRGDTSAGIIDDSTDEGDSRADELSIDELLDELDDFDQRSAASDHASSQTAPDDGHEDDEFFIGDLGLTAGERIGSEPKQNLLAGIEPEPVEMAWRKPGRRWSRILYPLACLLAALALLAQYAFFEFEQLARAGATRPLYAKICPLLDCTLPKQYDTRLIQSSNLIVRSHPDRRNALIVDAILTNRAHFTQPYPALELIFSDLSGKPVAARRFSPEEYLAGELLGRNLMPRQQPVHISLSIADPGEQAVNYQIHLHPGRED